MSKAKYIVRCQVCGYTAPKWLGRCPDCGEWNTMLEEPLQFNSSQIGPQHIHLEYPKPITEIAQEKEDRFSTYLPELDRVLGGGIVSGSLVLIGGEPGIGKSTLLLQMAYNLAGKIGRVLVVSGEESPRQISLRANRLGALSQELYLLSEVNVTAIEQHILEVGPKLIIIDSIQTMFHPDIPSSPGSVGQVRECTHFLMRIAKSANIPTFIVGHVTKDGSIAGPRVLEHMVDTVLYFEGESSLQFRIVRAVKNRYGSTNEIGVFEMGDQGLVEVSNPSMLFLNQRPQGASGSVAIATVEGTRPLLVELQALVTSSHLAMPRRMATGLDNNRLNLIVAVLDRRCGLGLSGEDIYCNVAGGVKITEPAADLGIALAVASAHKDITIDSDTIVIGEVGLGAEIRFVNQLEQRLKEAAKLGFNRALIPDQEVRFPKSTHIELVKVQNLSQALNFI